MKFKHHPLISLDFKPIISQTTIVPQGLWKIFLERWLWRGELDIFRDCRRRRGKGLKASATRQLWHWELLTRYNAMANGHTNGGQVDYLSYLSTSTPDSLSRSTKHANPSCHLAMGYQWSFSVLGSAKLEVNALSRPNCYRPNAAPPSPGAELESLELGCPHPKATPWTSKSKVQCGPPVKMAT